LAVQKGRRTYAVWSAEMKIRNEQDAKAAIAAYVAEADDSWRRGDERLITVDGVREPDGWYFVIVGMFDTVRG
jgi:hypothetical protein